MFSTGMMWGQVANRGSLNPTVAAGHIGHLREVPRYGIVGTLGTLGTLFNPLLEQMMVNQKGPERIYFHF